MAFAKETPYLELNRYKDGSEKESVHVKALLFDVEGVIIDSVVAQFDAFKGAIMNYTGHTALGGKTAKEIFLERMRTLQEKEPGKFPSYDDFTIEHYHAFISGRDREDGIRNLLDIPPKADATKEENDLIAALGKQKDIIFQQMLMEGKIKTFPAVIEMIKALHKAGVPMAFASGSSNAAMMLYKAGILHCFQKGVLKGRDKASGQDKKQVLLANPAEVKLSEGDTEIPAHYFTIINPQFDGKPRSWIFNRAARELKANPFKCAVFEDSPQIVHENFEEAFGAVVGVDTGNAFKRESVRAGNVFCLTEGKTADDVAREMAEYILARLQAPEVRAAHGELQRGPLSTSYGPSFFAHVLRGNGSPTVLSAMGAGGSSSPVYDSRKPLGFGNGVH